MLTEKLTDIADAIREKKDEGILSDYYYRGTISFVNDEMIEITIQKAKRIKLIVHSLVRDIENNVNIRIEDNKDAFGVNSKDEFPYTILFNGGDTLQFSHNWNSNRKTTVSLDVELIALDQEGNEIEMPKYTPEQMAQEIKDMTAGPPETALTITGNCYNYFNSGKWEWFLLRYGDLMTTNLIKQTNQLFSNCSTISKIPFDLNFNFANLESDTGINFKEMFKNCYVLKEVPKMNYYPINLNYFSTCSQMFQSCQDLKEVPNFLDDKSLTLYESSYSFPDLFNNTFNSCCRLRIISPQLLQWVSKIKSKKEITATYYSPYSYAFAYCYSLDKIEKLGVFQNAECKTKSTLFYNTFISLGHLKTLTFDANKTAKWAKQTIDLSNTVGYDVLDSYMGSKKIINDETYQLYKDDPDAWTDYLKYSRYNRASAVETINSLPDCSAYCAEQGATNTIKFKGESGSATDEGAINTMTEEEIAVATEKGWTVSFV